MKSPDKPPYSQLIGLTEDQAKAVAAELGASLRVLEKDGQSFVYSCELRENRINVALASGLVIDILGTG